MKIILSAEKKAPVSPSGIGLCLEDINFSLDGGLYAELLENRNFEAKHVHGKKDNYTVEEDGGYGWTPYPAEAQVARKIKTDRPLFAENPHYLRLTVQEGGTGIKNKAYDGIYLTQNMKYKFSCNLRSYDYKGTATIGVYAEGQPVLFKKIKIKADGKWRQYAFTLKSKVFAEKADFVFLLGAAGTVHLESFSMIPDNALKGVFRRDLVGLMRDLKPGFLRFPGGSVVEGNSLQNRYFWKNTIGAKERRKHNYNRWAAYKTCADNNFTTEFSHYGQTLGIGYYELLLLAEHIGAKPLPVLSVGIAGAQFVPFGSPELEGYIQEALDLIEFCNGGRDTEWGKVRAEMGHEAPFNLEYLGIGNGYLEDETLKDEYRKRFELFEKRIHEKYSEIKLIGAFGLAAGAPANKDAWEWLEKVLETNPDFVYCSDEHFYKSPEWMYHNANVYDRYPRNQKVFAGEYAAHIADKGAAGLNSPQANAFESALAEAAFMTGMERNADVVMMSSYAPLLARLGYTQWSPALIWFDAKKPYVTANYYVQQLFSLYSGNFSLKVSVQGGEKVFASATEREGLTYLKIVNAGTETLTANIEGDHDFGDMTRIIRLEGELDAYNTLEEPFKIVPKEIAPTAKRTVTLPPNSFNVLVFRK